VGFSGCPRVCYHWVSGGLCDFFHAIKNPHHYVVRVILLVEAAGIDLEYNLLIIFGLSYYHQFIVTSDVTLN
jgi:hypothetical protein